ncbi:MAG: 50S ribosomal protein L18e [Nitrososphaerota archaeon]|nr:50S ribosomal protein L18e [Nitrososphaerota archaeon]MDG6989886.1 50S ribosomal protein L18e [Nitrososphaerota archaeon]
MLERAAKKQDAPIWDLASRLLAGETKNRVEVNIGRISRMAESGQALFVPGKVLGTGVMDKKLIVGAFSFSASAKSKLESVGGSALSVEQFLKKYPKGSGVRLVK